MERKALVEIISRFDYILVARSKNYVVRNEAESKSRLKKLTL